MKINERWTPSKARLRFIKNQAGNQNWLFLPGGPGLGSESLQALTDLLDLPGNMWFLDLPGDGSNTTTDDAGYFSKWSEALYEACASFENVILVAHSSGGMFALATSGLEKVLKGLVLMDSAPNAAWQTYFMEYVNDHPIKEVSVLQGEYEENPSNEILKALTIACLPYFSLPQSYEKMVSIMESLPFNYKTHLWAAAFFDPIYEAEWIPQKIPTLIFAGDQDPITPIQLFRNSTAFHRENISIREIKNASHFPWIDQAAAVKLIFEEYSQSLI